MGLGKILKKLLPIAQTAGQIAIGGDVGNHQLAVLLRQGLLLGGGYLAGKGLLTGDQVEPVVGAILTLGTVGYGQLKSLKDKKEAIAMATRLPDSKAVVN